MRKPLLNKLIAITNQKIEMLNPESESIKQLEKAIKELKDHYLFRMNSSLSKTIFFSLVRGLSFGLGSVIGATILVYILILFLSQIEYKVSDNF